MADPFKVSVRGPLVGLVPSFRVELFRLGYASDTVAQQLRLIAGFVRWIADRKLVVVYFSVLLSGRTRVMADPFRVSVRGPLVGLVPSFREELFRLGYASYTVAQQLRLIAGLSRWVADRKRVVGELSDSVMESFMDAWRGS